MQPFASMAVNAAVHTTALQMDKTKLKWPVDDRGHIGPYFATFHITHIHRAGECFGRTDTKISSLSDKSCQLVRTTNCCHCNNVKDKTPAGACPVCLTLRIDDIIKAVVRFGHMLSIKYRSPSNFSVECLI
ncbi:unnamed protein product [Protopolystoma xenopodis]|uniref:Uncharacterized protein n=1 Tax=Protopolystoma xenopodis TaxID=117903 RepID=A0A3S5FGE9_9PLAT|nr:unnamed protein product [Protopolystoma xenopodis]